MHRIKRYWNRYLFFMLIFFLSPQILLSVEAEKRSHPFTVLVLSGGGARGIAHIGVLKVIEELHIPVDMVVGTSMGAIVGGLYSTGLSPSEIEKKMLDVDWNDIFSDNPKPLQQPYRLRKESSKYMGVEIGYAIKQIYIPKGVIAGQKLIIALNNILLPVLSVDNFDHLPIPFRAVATDLVTGERVDISSGNLTKAIMASMAIPGIFAPVEINNRTLVDGGIVANLAIETARELGAERIIAVDVSSPLATKDELKTLVDVTKQVLAIYGKQSHLYQLSLLKEGDILLSLKLEGFSNMDFKKAKKIIGAGEKAAKKEKDTLLTMSLPEEEYRQIKSYISARKKNKDIVVDYIKVITPKKVAPEMIESRIKTTTGKKLDIETLEQNITDIYATGLFERIDYYITQMDENYGLTIEPIIKPWGPKYLYLGAQFDSTRDFNPLLRYRITQINQRGGELNLRIKLGLEHNIEAEFYQPIDYADHFFIAPVVSYQQRNIDLFEDDNRYARYRTRYVSTGLFGGINIGNAGQFRIGIEEEHINSDLSTGDKALPDYKDNMFLLNSSFVIDRLDNLLFPREGWYVSVDYRSPLPVLEDNEFQQLSIKGLEAWNHSNNTLIAYIEAGTSFDTELPIYRTFYLGGFQRMSGFDHYELTGNHALLFRLSYIRDFEKLLPFNISGYFVGSSIEAGNVWEDTDDISLDEMKLSGSVFTGIKTPLGPIYIGYGIRSPEEGIFYFYLGPVF
ncbi:MAG: patatin-like phospholipase family protein [Candidatus Ratteibacteria bacterium]|nr:patatin-like phospholipase family protein [Candidatus Ratteibacteria bacterium]